MGKATIRRALYATAALIIVALVVGLYRAKSDASRTEAHVRALQTEIGDREAGLRSLRAEIAEQERPANIERMARERGDIVGSESSALPENTIDNRLPAPHSSAHQP